MLNNYYGIAEVAQTFKRGKQFFVVALMKSDARLVEDIEHAHKRTAYLCCKSDSLAFAAAQCA